MMRFLFVFFVLCVVSLRAGQPVAEILTVRGGTIYPTNVAAEVSAVAAAVAQAEAAAAQAEAVETAAAMVSNAVAGVTEIVNSLRVSATSVAMSCSLALASRPTPTQRPASSS